MAVHSASFLKKLSMPVGESNVPRKSTSFIYKEMVHRMNEHVRISRFGKSGYAPKYKFSQVENTIHPFLGRITIYVFIG